MILKPSFDRIVLDRRNQCISIDFQHKERWKKKSINDKWSSNRYLNGRVERKCLVEKIRHCACLFSVIDDHQLDRHFTENDIKELYKFTPEQLPELRPTSNTDFNYPIPKDHLLLDLLYEHNQWIHSYHSHDSLLENKLDEGLSEEERRRGRSKFYFLSNLLFV